MADNHQKELIAALKDELAEAQTLSDQNSYKFKQAQDSYEKMESRLVQQKTEFDGMKLKVHNMKRGAG